MKMYEIKSQNMYTELQTAQMHTPWHTHAMVLMVKAKKLVILVITKIIKSLAE